MVMFQTFDPDLITARNALLMDNWWLVALRGLFANLSGVIAFAMPAAVMLGLVLVFAAYNIADSISNTPLSVRGARRHLCWGLLLLNGLLGIAVGVIAAVRPGITMLAFVIMIAAWPLLSGGLILGAAVGRKISHPQWWLLFGRCRYAIVWASPVCKPADRSLGPHPVDGAYALVLGSSLFVLAFLLRRHRGEHCPGAVAAPI